MDRISQDVWEQLPTVFREQFVALIRTKALEADIASKEHAINYTITNDDKQRSRALSERARYYAFVDVLAIVGEKTLKSGDTNE